MRKDKLRLAILGCGAITRVRHLPAAVANDQVRVAMLVDSNVERATALRDLHHLEARISTDAASVVRHVVAAINSLPNLLHTPVTVHLLNAGIRVLCENPLAPSAADARLACDASQRGGA